MRRSLFTSLLFLLLAYGSEAADKPNVLFIAIDDLNDWVGCLGGNPNAKTPNIDRLAKRGMVFTNSECAAPACVPSRSALFIGVAPARSGLYSNFDGGYRKYPDLKVYTPLSLYFKQHGYRTMGAGKITHSVPKSDWDFYWNAEVKQPYWKNPLPKDYVKEKGIKGYLQNWRPLTCGNEEMTDWRAAQWAAGELKKKHTKPFFLTCGFYHPHEPWHVPQKYFDKFPLESLTLPKVKLDDMDDIDASAGRGRHPIMRNIEKDNTMWRKGVQAYLANVNFADDCVGVLLDALDSSAYKDNTIVMLWSDHGWHLGEKFRWSKFTLWEESARCVLICAAPGVAAPGSRCSQPVNLLDIYPSLLELCGLPKRKTLDGRSFAPQLKDPTVQRPPSITASHKGFSIRTPRWRYIRRANGSEELYDHTKDPMEWTNLAKSPDHASIIEKLRLHLPRNPRPQRNQKMKGR